MISRKDRVYIKDFTRAPGRFYMRVAHIVKEMVNIGNCLSSGFSISRPLGLLPAFPRFLAPTGASSPFSLSKCVNSKLFTAKQGHVSAEVVPFLFTSFPDDLGICLPSLHLFLWLFSF